MAADQVIRWTIAGAVVGVAAVASYEHAYALVRAHGEAGWTGRLVPLTVDGLIYASSMVMLDCARRKVPVPALARWSWCSRQPRVPVPQRSTCSASQASTRCGLAAHSCPAQSSAA